VRWSAREQLVEHGAERVDVGRGGHVLAEGLLRGEVGRGAQNGADLSECGRLRRTRDPEVGDLERAVAPQQEVLRLHVAVDEPRLVRVLEPVAGLEPEGDRLVGG